MRTIEAVELCLIVTILACCLTATHGGCHAYGHACLGGMGKRADDAALQSSLQLSRDDTQRPRTAHGYYNQLRQLLQRVAALDRQKQTARMTSQNDDFRRDVGDYSDRFYPVDERRTYADDDGGIATGDLGKLIDQTRRLGGISKKWQQPLMDPSSMGDDSEDVEGINDVRWLRKRSISTSRRR
ncbi:PREDICTED: uncharacterized protein LOC106809693 [Priapulus caudatus]|uniref:Uncharacterized protein LOC106809693 n=1 Tax=Priapulus caudatus TaxID=37621 RepID=A0ABM1E829_PRICU|nr:PREDICTED: uncharacterized protein LOC106809693 [Priapulus caudatus]